VFCETAAWVTDVCCCQLRATLDRDELCPRQDTCQLEFEVLVGPASLFNIISVNVSVLDVNDHRPQFADSAPVSLHVSEAAPPGTELPLPAAVDRDSPALGVARYELYPVGVRSVTA